MNRRELERLGRELREFLESMTDQMGRPERRAAMTAYLTGLLLDGDRKSVEPMAARLVDSPDEIQAMRQRLLGCVAESAWLDEEMLRRLACKFERELPGVEAFVIDDTGFPKKGVHSVGVARQYSGTLGRTDNCQVATSLHLASEAGSGCIGFQIYLPEKWASDAPRRAKVGVPEDVVFQRKWEIALSQLDDALRWGVRRHLVLADAGYGDIGEFREGVTARGLEYLMGVSGVLVVWPPGSAPRVQVRSGKRGRPHTRYRDDKHPPIAIKQFALTLDYRKVTWREGSRDWQSSRFAAARVRTAHRHQSGEPPGSEQWLLCEWPKGEAAPCKFYLATLPTGTSVRALVRSAKLRWRVERDYQELKQEIGLDHFEGRSWRGFHHHATLCATAHAFLALRRALFPPEQDEVDPADGPPSPSARPASAHRHLPPMPTDHQPRHSLARPVPDVEEAIQ
jgi:SRSO17 transposase